MKGMRVKEDDGRLAPDAAASGEGTLSFDLNHYLPYLLNRAGTRLATAFTRELEHFALTLPMWRVMAVLWHKGEQRLIELIQETSIEQSTLSRLLAVMDDRGLVNRNRDRADARAVLVTLTAAGKNLTGQLIPLALRNEGVAQQGFTDEEIRVLHSMLRRIFDNSADLLR